MHLHTRTDMRLKCRLADKRVLQRQARTCIQHGKAASTDRCHGAAAVALCDGALHSDGVGELLLQQESMLSAHNEYAVTYCWIVCSSGFR